MRQATIAFLCTFFSGALFSVLAVRVFHALKGTCAMLRDSKINRLTDKEKKIALFVAECFNNDEIGLRVNLSPSTVSSYLTGIYEKLGIAKEGDRRLKLANFMWKFVK